MCLQLKNKVIDINLIMTYTFILVQLTVTLFFFLGGEETGESDSVFTIESTSDISPMILLSLITGSGRGAGKSSKQMTLLSLSESILSAGGRVGDKHASGKLKAGEFD